MYWSHVIQTQARKLWWMHCNFVAVYQGGSKFAQENRKTQTARIVVFSDKRNPPFQFESLTHTWYFCAYSGLQIHKNTLNLFMYLVLLCLMWSSASESKSVHSRYSRPRQVWRTAEPIRIQSAVLNWFGGLTWHELNCLNSIQLMWSTAYEPGLRHVTVTDFVL